MAYTLEQVSALQDAIAQGVMKVKYSDKEVEYRSLAEMQQILADMRAELGIGQKRRRFASFSKGIK
jgi:hypothetical protein